MVTKAGEMGQNFLTSVVNFFTDLPYKIGYFIGEALANIALWVVNMVDKAHEMGTNFINKVVEFFTQLPGNVLRFITSAYENVRVWAVNMASKAAETGTNFLNNIVSFFTQLPGRIYEFITSAFNNVQQWAVNMANKATEAGTNFINNVISFMQQLPGKIKQHLDEAIIRLATWVGQMGAKGTEAVGSLIDNVMSAAASIPERVKEIGQNIVNGVWSGIVAARDSFVRNVTGFFSGIVDGVRNTLQIHSPSRVFRDRVGKWLPPGVVDGFKAAMPAAMKSIQSLLEKGIDGLNADDISIGADDMVSIFANRLKSMYNDVAIWFESIENRVCDSVDRMEKSLSSLIKTGQLIVNGDGSLGYVGYNGFISEKNSSRSTDKSQSKPDYKGGGDTYIFNSPKAIDEIEAAKQLKRTKRDISEGFS